jgi:hypothetical protein
MSGRRPFDSDPLCRAGYSLSAGKAGIYGRTLSIITTVLPREKVLQRAGTSLNSRNPFALIDWPTIPVIINDVSRATPERSKFHSKFTVCQA